MLSSLNSKQRIAALERENSIIIACPGSGKTRVLAHKVAYNLKELENNCSKRFVIALTFTNRAAEEIGYRLEMLDVNVKNLWSGTIHAFCLDWIIRPYAGYSELTKDGFTIIDDYIKDQLIDEICTKFNLVWGFRTRKNKTGEILNNRTYAEKQAAIAYHEVLRTNKYLDFDLILYISYQILLQYPHISKTLSRVIHLICIDEYQDTQDLQYAIISEIIKNSDCMTKVFYVGDPDQAIYGSIGGIAKTKDEISEEVGGQPIEPLELTGNYRSCQRIIDFYSNFQLSNISIKAEGENACSEGLITYHNDIHKDDVHILISKLIKASLKQGIPEHEICVIAPQWTMVIAIARKLIGLLPNVTFDAPGLSPLRRNKENFWFKLARLFLTEHSPKMFITRIRWTNEIIRELENYFKVRAHDLGIDNRLILRIVNTIQLDETDGIEYLKKAFEDLMKEINLDFNSNEVLVTQLEAFFAGAYNLRENHPEIPTDIDSFRKMFRDRQGIVVNTCHGVKGEEYETVIAYGLLRGFVPHWEQIGNANEEMTASNRMLYVISSRSKTRLHLISEIGRQTRRGAQYEPTPELINLEFDYDFIYLD